jgi:MFS family permease
MVISDTAAERNGFGLERHKSFHQFLVVWIGQLLSMIGSGLTGFALGVYAFGRTAMATYAALVTLMSFLPSILLRPIGGIWADRFDRRLMMIIGDIGSAAGIAFILLFMLSGEPELWHIYAGVTLSSVFVGIQSPAYKASATDLLTEDQYSKGSGLVQLAESSRFLLSPFLAGLIMHHFNIETVLTLDIITFAAAVLTVLVIRKPMKPARHAEESGHWLDELKDGWQAIVANRGVFLLIIMISLVTFFLGFLETLIGPMVLSFTDAKTFGTIQSVCAVGMLTGMGNRRHPLPARLHRGLWPVGTAGRSCVQSAAGRGRSARLFRRPAHRNGAGQRHRPHVRHLRHSGGVLGARPVRNPIRPRACRKRLHPSRSRAKIARKGRNHVIRSGNKPRKRTGPLRIAEKFFCSALFTTAFGCDKIIIACFK